MGKSDLFETISCPLCGSPDFTVIYPPKYPAGLQKDDLLTMYYSSSDQKLLDQMVVCNSCSLVYLNPRVKYGIILESYSQAIDPAFVKQNLTRIRTFDRELRQIIKKYNIRADEHKRVLDIGCAGGAFLKAAHDLGFSVTGVEPSAWLCEYGKNEYGLDIRSGVLSDYDFDAASFDIISLWDVVEHLPMPCKVLSRAHTLLKDDGLLIVNYPDYDSWAARFLGSRWPFLLSVHLFYYTPGTMKTQLAQCGFEIVEMKPYWQVLELGYILRRASGYFKFVGILETIVRLIGLSAICVKYNMGQTRIIAKKING
ncbi:MAG: class I SAM-dependent methyltransferase [Candidatus Brocadiaceae bacterium]|nr:class I SAM-dependent methyltransferase [Candidatus Brocadiaceae bacterium]